MPLIEKEQKLEFYDTCVEQSAMAKISDEVILLVRRGHDNTTLKYYPAYPIPNPDYDDEEEEKGIENATDTIPCFC